MEIKLFASIIYIFLFFLFFGIFFNFITNKIKKIILFIKLFSIKNVDKNEIFLNFLFFYSSLSKKLTTRLKFENYLKSFFLYNKDILFTLFFCKNYLKLLKVKKKNLYYKLILFQLTS